MASYKLTAEIEVKHQPPGMGLPDDEYEVSYPKIEIEYRYSPGDPGCMYQRNGDPGWPPEPAEVDLIGAKLIAGDGLLPTAAQVQDWAQDFLDSESGFNEAVSHAEDMRRPDPDYEREKRLDDAR